MTAGGLARVGALRVDHRGWLLSEGEAPLVKRFFTVRTSPLLVPTPRGLVWHWTGGTGGPRYCERLARDVRQYRGGGPAPSWHLVIGADGALYQAAPFLEGTWHVGRPGAVGGQRFENVNRATVGVELENAGRLMQIGERVYRYPYWARARGGAPKAPNPNLAVDRHRVIDVPGAGLFDRFTLAQERTAALLIRALAKAYGLTPEAFRYGHADFDASQREDPGPVWMERHLPRALEAAFASGA